MAIDTAERRRAVIDFGKITGTGMPIPSGLRNTAWRVHASNLYPGVAPIFIPFMTWGVRMLTQSFWQTPKAMAD